VGVGKKRPAKCAAVTRINSLLPAQTEYWTNFW